MTASVSRQTFDQLARANTGPCVSIVVPLDRRHPDEYLAHTMLKELTNQARDQLAGRGSAEVEQLLAAPTAALDGPLAANGRSATGFYSGPDFSIELPLHCEVAPLSVVDDRFQISPLLPMLAEDASGFVLTVGAEHVRLYRIANSRLDECDVPGFEHSVDDALWFDRVERHAGAHSGQAAREGRKATITHGSGAQHEDRKERLERFYHYVDHTVLDFLGGHRSQPLLLVGTGPEVARFQHVTRHPHAVPLPGGSPARLSHSELESRAVQAVQDQTSVVGDVLQRFAALNGTGRASGDLVTIVAAATEGRIDTLLVGDPSPVHGTCIDGQVKLSSPDEPSGDAVDLVNLAVSDAWRTGASVRTTSSDRLPTGSPLAATFRY